MRILHITPDYHPAAGGGELWIREVSERLAARGHDVTVLALNSRGIRDNRGQNLPSEDVLNGVTLRRLNSTYRLHERFLGIRGAQRALQVVFGGDRMRMLSGSPVSISAFARTLAARADLVAVVNWYHTSLAYQTALARSFGKFAYVGVPLFHTDRPWAHARTLDGILARCDAIVAMTAHEKRFVEARAHREHAHVVGAGVEPRLFERADGAGLRAAYGLGNAPVVGYIGRISNTKGVATLIRAMAILWQTNADVRLVLAGSGTPADANTDDDTRNAFASLTAEQRARVVCITRFTDSEKASICDALDVLAMPSVAESFGIAYLEAWMRRKPVIGSRIPSTQCVIEPGVDGLLVTPDEPRELADAIDRLLRDRVTRERMGAAGHAKTLGAYTWEKVTDRIENVYLHVAFGKERRPHSAAAIA